jgi:excisionase family DNA binding protein
MNLDYYFPLFESILQGNMNPLLPENNADTDYRLRMQEQIIEHATDEGSFTLTYPKWQHPKGDYYRKLLLSETFVYCNEVLACLQAETNIQIRTYYREMILDRHLTTCLQRLGEVIMKSGLKLNSLSQPTSEDTTESLANCYVLHFLKVCLAKAYLEVQAELVDVVIMSQSEMMLYSVYFHELPPVRTFLVKRTGSEGHKPVDGIGSAKKGGVQSVVPATDDIPDVEYMLVKEAAEKLKASEKTIRRRLESGELKGMKDKGRWLIDKKVFKEYLNGIEKL